MKYHEILSNRVKSWRELEKEIERLNDPVEIGEVFEQFVFIYLSLKNNLYQINRIYRTKEIPAQIKRDLALEKRDYGVDGVFVLKDGNICAYQVKFRKNRIMPSYSELTKFWSEAEHADFCYTIANSYDLPRIVRKKEKHKAILAGVFEELGESFFEELREFIEKGKAEKKSRYEPDPHQKRAIARITDGFRTENRGKYIAACGTGKTITALWTIEELGTQYVLFVTPSLALIKQTLEEWAEQAKEAFSYLCVCSDITVAEEVDNGDITVSDLNFPVTTNPLHIKKFLSDANRNEKRIIFSTYQSLDALADGVNKVNNFIFDIIICDEAHRTAGVKGSLLFSLVLRDEYIRSRKRLFMTATERLVRPWLKEKAKEHDRVIFSMDDEEVYGKVFERFNFGEAIKRNVISDYKIIVAGIEINEIYDWIRKNQLLICLENNKKEYFTCAQNIFRQVLLVKAVKEFPIRKIITFHNTIKGAHDYIYGTGNDDLDLKTVIKKIWPELEDQKLYLDHINSHMTAGERKEKLELFKEYAVGIISNARCLTEGVDVPVIDSVYFVNPKSSLIDIVQSCGRALRKPRKTKVTKTAYFIIPLLIPEDGKGAEVINSIDFETLHNVIQALRDQDSRLADWIDKLNLHASKGRIGDFHRDTESPIILDVPEKFDPKEFERRLYLKVAEANAEPIRYEYKTKTYGVKERKSQYKRIFKTLGDYSSEAYKDNLVLPTIREYRTMDSELSMDELKIDNNNVSHTERLGLIKKEATKYLLTPLGKQYWENKVSFVDLFKRQMLRYFSLVVNNGEERFLFPYRDCLRILLKVKYINFIEFVFGLYSIVDSSDESINDSIERIRWIRKNYPRIELLNKTNRSIVLNKLNKEFGTNFSDTDIWEKKTTVYNQYIYFRNHFELFAEIIKVDPIKKSISIIKGSELKIKDILKRETIEGEGGKSSIEDLMKRYTDKLIIVKVYNEV